MTKEQIEEANKNNVCFLHICPNCRADVIKEKIELSKKYKMDAWTTGCPKCNYSFCD